MKVERNGSSGGQASAFSYLVKLRILLVIGAAGLFLAAGGGAYLVNHFLPMPFPDFLPLYFEGIVLGLAAVGLIAASLYGLYGSRAPVFLSARHPSTGVAQTIYTRRQKENGPKIVAVGGGTGLSTLLRGLKDHDSDLTAVVSVADDGGSSGRLRRELGILPPGDFRNCLVAMADAEPLVTRLFQYRFGRGSGLEGHSFGNLFIVAMSGVTGSFERAIHESSHILAVKGRIMPATIANLSLSAEMYDQSVVHGESSITERGGRIKNLYLTPKDPEAYPDSVKAILDADLIVIGPGSLYTSILPNLLVPGIRRAIRESNAMKIYVCNVATQKGETDGFSVGDHLRALQRHTSSPLVNYVMANNNLRPLGRQFTGTPVECREWDVEDVKLVEGDLINREFRLHHDPEKLAAAILDLYYNEWRTRHSNNGKRPTDRAKTRT